MRLGVREHVRVKLVILKRGPPGHVYKRITPVTTAGPMGGGGGGGGGGGAEGNRNREQVACILGPGNRSRVFSTA